MSPIEFRHSINWVYFCLINPTWKEEMETLQHTLHYFFYNYTGTYKICWMWHIKMLFSEERNHACNKLVPLFSAFTVWPHRTLGLFLVLSCLYCLCVLLILYITLGQFPFLEVLPKETWLVICCLLKSLSRKVCKSHEHRASRCYLILQTPSHPVGPPDGQPTRQPVIHSVI